MPIYNSLAKLANGVDLNDSEANELETWAKKSGQYDAVAKIANGVDLNESEASTLDSLAQEYDSPKPKEEEGPGLASRIADAAASVANFGVDAAQAVGRMASGDLKNRVLSAATKIPHAAGEALGTMADISQRAAIGLLNSGAGGNAYTEGMDAPQMPKPSEAMGIKPNAALHEDVSRGFEKGVQKYLDLPAMIEKARTGETMSYDQLGQEFEGRISAEAKAKTQGADEAGRAAFENAGGGIKGAAAEIGTVVGKNLLDPELAMNSAATQLPNMLMMMASGGAGGAKVAAGVGAAVQGSDVGGQVYEDLMDADPSMWEMHGEYQERIAKGEDPKTVKQDIAARAASQAFIPSALASMALNSTQMGSLTERALAKTALSGDAAKLAGEGFAKTAARGLGKAAGESLTEGAEEATAVFGGMAKNQVTGEDVWTDVGSNVAGGIIGMGPGSTALGGIEAFSERSQARKTTSEPPTAAQSLASAAPAPKAQPAPIVPEGSEAPDTIGASNIAAKKADIDNGFKAILAANPAMADEAAKWRSANPMGEAADFETHFAGVQAQSAQAQAAESPKVQEAQAQADQVMAQAQAGQDIASGVADPSQAPPAGLTIKEAVQAAQDGGAKLQGKAQAAQENVRTVEQTVVKDIEKAQGENPADGVLDEVKKAAGVKFSTYKELVKEGVSSLNPDKFMEFALASGMDEEAAAMELDLMGGKLLNKAKKEDEKTQKTAEGAQGFTPAQGGETATSASRVEIASPSAVIGSPTLAMTGAGKTYQYHLAVVPMAELRTSDTEGYPAEVQPRDRNRFTANETVRRIGKSLNPDVLMNTPTATDGPPVIGPDMVVEGGNGRVMGMRAAKGTPGWASYQETLRTRAQGYGIDPAKLEGIVDPVLVRVRSHDVADRGKYARELNQSNTNSLNLAAQVKSDAADLTPNIMNKLVENRPVSSPANVDFVNAFLSKVVNESERPAMYDRNDEPSKYAFRRINDALFYLAFGGSKSEASSLILDKIVEIEDEKMAGKKNLANALQAAAPMMAKLESMIASGDIRDVSVSGPLMDACQNLYHITETRMSIDDFLAQVGMFDEVDPFVAQIMLNIDALRRSSAKLTSTLREYARLAIENVATKDDLIEGTIQPESLTPEAIWAAAFEEVNRVAGTESPSGKAEDQQGQPDLFAQPSEGAPNADQPGPQAGQPGLAAPAAAAEELAPAFGANNKIFTADKAAALRARAKELLDAQRATLSANPMPDFELMQIGAQLAGFYLEGGLRKFADLAAAVSRDLGSSVRDLRAYLPAWYLGGKALLRSHGMTVDDMEAEDEVYRQMEVMSSAKPAMTKVVDGAHAPLVQALIAFGRIPKDNRELRSMMTEIDGQDPDGLRMKEGQEAIETILAANNRGEIVAMRADGRGQEEIFQAMVASYEAQPLLNIRTTASLENQAYSTPAPMAYLASEFVGPNASTYEPTAGNGSLLIGIDPGKVWANELDSRRYENARGMAFAHLRNGDAMDAVTSGFVKTHSVDAVVMNPPFGKADEIVFDGYHFKKIDHQIAAESLQAMKDDGRATILIGGTKNEVMAGPDKIFLGWLYRRYNVVGSFQMSGDLYKRQGAAWPVRVLVVNGRGKSSLNHLEPVNEARTWAEVYQNGRAILDSEAFGKRSPELPSEPPRRKAPGEEGDSRPDRVFPGRPDPRSKGTGDGSGSPSVQPASGPSEPVVPDGGGVVADGAGADVPGPAGLEPDGPSAVEPGRGELDAGPVPPDGARSVVDAVVDLDSLVQPYIPSTYQTELDGEVFAPTNLVEPMAIGEKFLREKIGDPIQYLTEKLKYSEQELKDALMGLQAESVAAAIYNMENGSGTIIADDTGVGKGRQAYMMIRWAILKGLTPVFLTEKASLFSAMWSDAQDCGDNGLMKPFVVNNEKIETERGGVVSSLPRHDAGDKSRAQVFTEIGQTKAIPPTFNAVFATYSQFNQANAQRGMLRGIAENSVLIMDEAHNAAGESSSTGKFFREMMPSFKGVSYFSATWAKRPDNMTAYTKSGIGDIGMDDEKLSESISSGGYALQGEIAASLAKFGQFFRRERSFAGVEYNTKVYGQDGSSGAATTADHIEVHDKITEILRGIVDADRAFNKFFEEEMKPQLVKSGASLANHKTAGSQINRMPFTSIVHNAVRQIAFALKADWAADMAIESLRQGKAPVLAMESTMGAFLEHHITANDIADGAPLTDFNWGTILERYLMRTLYYTTKDEKGEGDTGKTGKAKNKGLRVEVPLEMLPYGVRAMYDDVLRQVKELSVDAPASPIDWMRHRIEQAGYSVSEITGRKHMVDYSSGIVPVLAVKKDGTREEIRRKFNTRKTGAVILNAAGATGISLHADRRWATEADQRHMIIVQAFQDINLFKQVLGRVHRTNQIIPPMFSVLALDLPSEVRPISRLQSKIKGLNSSTSANTKGNMDVQGADILNRYGDEIVQQYLLENPEMAGYLDIKLSMDEEEKNTNEGAKKKQSFQREIALDATGSLALLPVYLQQQFYNEVIPRYQDYIKRLNETGENKLVKRTLDYQAKLVSRSTLFPGTGKEGPFSSPAYLDLVEVKNLGRILKPEDVQLQIDETLQGMSPAEHRTSVLASAAETWKTFVETAPLDKMEAANKAKRDTAALLPEVGSEWIIKIMGDVVSGVVTRTRWGHEKLGNPYQSSKFKVRIATNSTFGAVEYSLNHFLLSSESMIGFGLEGIFQDDGSATSKRYIVSGNIFGAYSQLEKHGEILAHTTSEGKIVTSMLLPKDFNPKSDIKSQIKITGGENITATMQKLQGSIDPFLLPEDGSAIITIHDGYAIIELQSKAKPEVLRWSALTGLEFAGNEARVRIGEESTKAFRNTPLMVERGILEDVGAMKDGALTLDAILDPNANFVNITEAHLDLAAEILGKDGVYINRYEYRNTLRSLKETHATMGKITADIFRAANSLMDGTADLKDLKQIVKGIMAKRGMIRGVTPAAAKKAIGNVSRVSRALTDMEFISKTIIRASALQRIKGRRVPIGLVTVPSAMIPALKDLFPYASEASELKAFAEYCLYTYNRKNPEEQLPSLALMPDREKFLSYIKDQQSQKARSTTNSVPMAGVIALGIAGATYATGIPLPPVLFGAVTTFAALNLMKAGIRSLQERFTGFHITPRGKILSVEANGTNSAVVENLDEMAFRKLEIHARPKAWCDNISRQIQDVAISMAFPNASPIRDFKEHKIFPSKEVEAINEKLNRAVSDFLEAKAELPPEIAHLEGSILRVRKYWTDHLESIGAGVIEDHFHRVYDFDGLQALKNDPAALVNLVDAMVPVVMKESQSQERIDRFASEHGITDKTDAARMYVLAVMEGMYDGTKESRKKVQSARNEAKKDFALKVMEMFGDAKLPMLEYFLNRVSVRPSIAGGMKERVVPFTLPAEWTLSDGSTVQLVERNWSKVMKKYNWTMANSIAQRSTMKKTLINDFLNSIGPVGSGALRTVGGRRRAEIENFVFGDIDNRTWNVPLPELAQSWIRRMKLVQTLTFLGLNTAFFLNNIAFGGPKAVFLLGTEGMKGFLDANKAMFMKRGEDFKNAYEAGAIFSEISESMIGDDANPFTRAIMMPLTRSQQAVDFAGFMAGRRYAPTLVKQAARGNEEAQKMMREIFTSDLAAQILNRETLSLTPNEINRIGLHYRNLISGTGRNLNAPTALGTEIGSWIGQFMKIPSEDLKFFVDRVMPSKKAWRYYATMALIGACKTALYSSAAAAYALVAGGQGGDEDEPEESTDWLSEFALNSMASAGGIAIVMPLAGVLAGVRSKTLPRNPNDLALKLAGGTLPIVTTAKAAFAIGETMGNIKDAQASGDFGLAEKMTVAMAPIARLFWNQMPVTRQLDVRMDATEAEETMR